MEAPSGGYLVTYEANIQPLSPTSVPLSDHESLQRLWRKGINQAGGDTESTGDALCGAAWHVLATPMF